MPIPETTPDLSRRTIRDQIYLTVREWIVAGVLQSGETLRDKELAERLGVSRTPVREALQRLKDEEFVQTEANRWTRVAPIDHAMVAEIYQVVRALESEAMRVTGVRLGPEDIDVMAAANDRLRAALEVKDGPEASRADSDFHDAFVRKCGNQHLIRIMDDLRVRLRRAEIAYFHGGLVAATSVDEHEEVVAALRRGDYEMAASAVRGNWDSSLQRLRRSQPSAGEETARSCATGSAE